MGVAMRVFEIDRENPGVWRKRPPFQNPGDAHVNLDIHMNIYPFCSSDGQNIKC
jgi:hypothetical protein